jgi:hypothetical protein
MTKLDGPLVQQTALTTPPLHSQQLCVRTLLAQGKQEEAQVSSGELSEDSVRTQEAHFRSGSSG